MPHAEHKWGGYHLPMIIVKDNGEQKTNEAHRERQSPDSGGGVMLDCYNQRAVEDYSVTITTRINSANHYYVIEEDKRNGENDSEDMGQGDTAL